MSARRLLRYAAFALLAGLGAEAQQHSVFDVDDFIDPSLHRQAVYSFRVVTGGVWNFIDDYRPANRDLGFVHITNSVYWKDFQFDYKHTEVRDEEPDVQVCACSPPIYFPTPLPSDATPAPPHARSKDAAQFSLYASVGRGPGDGIPITVRYRFTWTRQLLHTNILSPITGKVVSQRSGREESFGVDGDTYLHILGRDLFGSIQIARTVRSGTVDPRKQTEITYSHRFPGSSYKRVLFRPILTVGTITNREGTAINLVNPYFEAFFHESKTRVNFHLVYSPQLLNDGAKGWTAHHQVAIFADWGIVKLFGPHL